MKGKTGQQAAHGSKGNKARAGNHGPSQQSSSDKEAMTYAGKCGKNK